MTTNDEKACAHCNGAQWLYTPDRLEARPCICLERKERDRFLGPGLADAAHVESELYQPRMDPATGKVVGDRTRENLFLCGAWDMVRRHIKWAVGGRRYYEPRFTFYMTNDEHLLHVWLGDEHAKNNASRKDWDDDYVPVNGLRSIIEKPDLLILRFGVQQTKNRAASSVLREALAIREFHGKISWIVEGTYPFTPAKSYIWSAELADYLESNFATIDLGGDIEAERRNEEAKREALDSETDASLDGEDTHEPHDVQGEPGPLAGGPSRRAKPLRKASRNSGGGLPGL